jgi:hypothetical protein
MNVQSTNNTHAMNALRVYDDGRSAAIVLMASDDAEIEDALSRVFEIHEAPLSDLEAGVPWGADDVGDCEIRPGGVMLTVEGTGGSFMGLRFEAAWNTTSPGWRRAARDNGCAWLTLPGRSMYDHIARAVASGSQVQLPAMPVLKLEVTR